MSLEERTSARVVRTTTNFSSSSGSVVKTRSVVYNTRIVNGERVEEVIEESNSTQDAIEKHFSAMAIEEPKSGSTKKLNVKEFEKECLETHNEYRALHGVPPLKLSKKLSAYATEWAKKLASGGVLEHRPDCDYGENLFGKYGTGNVSVDGRETVQTWYNEIANYNFSKSEFAPNTGHFTQVVWKDSKKLGIGVASNSKGQVFVVANYDPAGNYQGQYRENVLPAINRCKQIAGAATPSSSLAANKAIKTDKVKSTVASTNPDDFDQFERDCLIAHNRYRAKHGAQPLQLNRKLCLYAKEWANNLAARGVMQHRSNPPYGENLFCKYGSGNVTVEGADAVDSWYSEIQTYRFGSGGFSMNTGHFTQVVWKQSRELGVGLARNGKGQIFVVANYNPPGNVQGQFSENVLPPK